MPLQSGTRLGAYEIVAPLGAGGMGEVYRARDTRLDRTVALKILPSHFASRGELRERFEREARVVSNLNHPNICTLYDVGHQDDVAYFVMEFLDGQTLGERISRGPLPLEQVLRFAIDIADALAKAHRHGIVHRDLKPGNVMLTPSGAKLLDFGLARRATEAAIVMSDAPTVHGAALTAEGTIVGTLQYMSPEQLEGGEVDARSDIFSFGALLYEMTTGRRAFEGTSHASLITKIMSTEPPPVRQLAPVTPAVLEHLICRCLAKEPNARWQCAGDLVAELRAIASGGAIAAVPAPRAKRPIIAWSVAAAMAVLAAILGALLARPGKPSQSAMRFTIASPSADGSISASMLWIPTAVSPDGQRIIMRILEPNAGSLWLRTLRGDAKRLDGTADATAPFWSPDGRRVGFFANGKLRTIDVDTGTIEPVCDVVPGGLFTATWAGDTIVFSEIARGSAPIVAVPSSGGTPRPVASVPGAFGHHFPAFLSDGRRFLFNAIESASTSLWVGSLDGKPPRKVAADFMRVTFVAPYLHFTRDGVLYAQRFDETELRLQGEAVPLANNIATYRPIGSAWHTAGGSTLVYLQYPNPSRLLWIDAQGKELGPAAQPGLYEDVRISGDGRRIAASIQEPKFGVSDVHTIDATRRTSTRVTLGSSDYNGPIFTRDGTHLVYSSDKGGPPHLFMQPIAGGAEQELVKLGGIQIPTDTLPDGRVVFTENVAETRADIHFVSPVDRTRVPWLKTQFNESQGRVSPDGKWMSYCSDESGHAEVYVTTIAPGGERARVSRNGGCRSAWAADGRALYYLQRSELFSVPIRIAGNAIDAGEPALIFRAASIVTFDTAPDGRLLVATLEQQTLSRPLHVILNWQEEVEAKSAAR
jgi:eukaryotic-like serine/threonine-protein kinase